MKAIKSLLLIAAVAVIISTLSAKFFEKEQTVPLSELQRNGFKKYDLINPNLLIYPLKNIKENTQYFLIHTDSQKVNYYQELFDSRFNELVYVLNFKKTDFWSESMNRYNNLLGVINTDPLYKGKIPGSNKKIDEHINVLRSIQDRYPADTPYWRLIKQSIDATEGLY